MRSAGSVGGPCRDGRADRERGQRGAGFNTPMGGRVCHNVRVCVARDTHNPFEESNPCWTSQPTQTMSFATALRQLLAGRDFETLRVPALEGFATPPSEPPRRNRPGLKSSPGSQRNARQSCWSVLSVMFRSAFSTRVTVGRLIPSAFANCDLSQARVRSRARRPPATLSGVVSQLDSPARHAVFGGPADWTKVQ